MAKAKKPVKEPAVPLPHPQKEILNLIVADLTTNIGDGGTVEDRQKTIDRLNEVLANL